MSREGVKVLMLRELTEGFRVSIVYYVRRWTDLLASEWQEYVKQGSVHQLAEVLVHNLRDAAASNIINIDNTLRVYAEHFGHTALSLVSYDSLIESREDLFSHFAQTFLETADLPLQKAASINTRLTPGRTEIMRLFNCLQQETGIPSGGLLGFLTLSHAPSTLTALLDHLATFESTIEVDDNDPAAREIVLSCALRYLPNCVRPAVPDRLYRPQRIHLPFISGGYALTPGFAELVRGLWRDLLALTTDRRVSMP